MRITSKSGIIPVGAVVMLPGGEDFYIIKDYDVDEAEYVVVPCEFDGDDYVESGDEVRLTPFELLGGDYETQD